MHVSHSTSLSLSPPPRSVAFTTVSHPNTFEIKHRKETQRKLSVVYSACDVALGIEVLPIRPLDERDDPQLNVTGINIHISTTFTQRGDQIDE